jgi:hypothetical protein
MLVGGFCGVPIGSREFLTQGWMTLEKVPKVGAVRRWLHLAAKALGLDPTRHCLVLSCSSGQRCFTGADPVATGAAPTETSCLCVCV